MRVLVCLAVAGLLIPAIASSASANKPVKSQFVDFGDQIIDGHVRAPTVLWATADKRAEFGRLMALKKDMIPGIGAALKLRSFK